MDPVSVLLSGAGGSAAANVLDALRASERQYRTIGVDASPLKLHLSRADVRAVVPRASEPGFVPALQRLVAEHRVDALHPQPDPDVLAIGAARDTLGAATYLPAQATLELVADKEACARHLAAAGVAVPESAAIESLESAGEVVADLLTRHAGVWVRARRGAGARASLPVRRPEQAIAWVRWWVEERGLRADEFMASEQLPGREYAYQSVWQDGELVAGQARERLEYLYGHLTPSGQSSTPAVARTVRMPDVDDLAQRSVRALESPPCGVYCIDMKEDARGTPRVTEVNAGRFFTTANFFAHAGLNMPELLIRCALGERPERRGSSPLPPDLYWIRMVDMGWTLIDGAAIDVWPRADR